MDRIDDAYNGLMGDEFMRKTRERLHWICSKVQGAKILDVGCSQGTLARILGSLGKNVQAVDINSDAIAFAGEKLAEMDSATRNRVRFLALNFMDFKTDERYDSVVIGEVLEHLVCPEAFVEKAYGHLVEDGVIVITVPFGINDDPDHRHTFYWSWINEIVSPCFDIREFRFFGKWIGVVGVKREKKAVAESSIPFSVVKDLEAAFYAIERPIVNDNKTRGERIKALSAAHSAELAKQKEALSKAAAEKKEAVEAAEKQKTVLEGEIARQRTALAAEQSKAQDLTSKLMSAHDELSAIKNEALELRVNRDAEQRVAAGQTEQIAVLKAALQYVANRQQPESAEMRLLEYSREMRELRSAFDAKRDELTERAERMGRLAGEVEALKESRDSLSLKVEELSASLAEATSVLDSKEEAMKRLAEAYSELEKELADKKDTLRKLEEERQLIQSALSVAEGEAVSARSETEVLKSEADRLEADLARAHRENENLRRKVDTQQEALDSQKAAAAKCNSELAQTRSSLAAEQKKTEEVKAALDKTVAELKAKESQATSLQNQNCRISQEKDRAKRKFEVERKRYDMLAKSKLGRLTLKYWRWKDGHKTQGSPDKHVISTCQDIDFPVSVIIPTYRETSSIFKAVESVLTQNYQSKIQVYVCVNGGDRNWYKKLREVYKHTSSVQVLYTSNKGANAGRNLGLQRVKTPLVTFLDDDDYFTSGYILALAVGFNDPEVTISAGQVFDFDIEKDALDKKTYINDALCRVDYGKTREYLKIGSIFGSFCMKMYKTSLFKSCFKELREDLPHSEDVIFWCENIGRIEGAIYVVNSGDEAYIRIKSSNSLSRPAIEKEYEFFITDRLYMLQLMAGCLMNSSGSVFQKKFILAKIKTHTNIIKKYYDSLPVPVRAQAQKEIFDCNCLFLNKSIFSNRRAIAFCHNFSPAVDASAFVATKRLSEIDKLEGGPLHWIVIKQNMCKIRKADLEFQAYYSDFRLAEQVYLNGSFGFAPAAQQGYATDALAAASDMDVEVIYSRALFVGSHMAAAQYKKMHPRAKWYAEFSDPIAYGVDNNPRACVGKPTWFDIEQLVYDGADVIIFTNRNQMEYMLSYNPNPEKNDSIRRRALVLRHPVLPHEYCQLTNFEYEMDDNVINIGFFGTFYVTRKADDMLNLLANPKVVLHIFTTNPDDMKNELARYGRQIRVNSTISHFEFLNLATRLDYLVLNDTAFPGKINPYQPSKYSDYLCTKTQIIAKTDKGSVLSEEQSAQLIKVDSITPDFAKTLKKAKSPYS